jgi:site-specific recombinase XerD
MNFSETTKENYLESVKLYLRYLKEYKGKNDIITVCNVSKEDIYNYLAYLDGKSKNTIKNRLYGIKNFYGFLNRDLKRELFEDIKLYGSAIKLPKILSWFEIDLLCDYYTDTRNKLIVFLFMQTGIRLSELANIKVNNINMVDQYVNVISKGGNQRQVYLSNKSMKLLKEYLKEYKPEGNLFKIKAREIQYIITNAMKTLGIKGSTHTLRHTIATKMYEQTQDILLVKEFLGHRSITSTQIYTHISNKLSKEAVERNPLAHFGVGGK